MIMTGRDKEVAELLGLYDKDSAEPVAIYGRRRVGKTYLVDETFKDKITFRHAGLSPVEIKEQVRPQPLKDQLQAFYYSLLSQGMKRDHCPKDWLEAFFMLEMHLQAIDDGSRQLIFLDEPGRLAEAADAAREIVEENADKSDLEKLKAYKDKICELASYDHDVVLNASESGNPWQVINVFDGDESTNIVCEGYAKAFQYLCDLSTFRSGRVRSHIVIGDMVGGTGAGPHMWNIVHMNDGRNYLVDVTDCDENTVGAPDLLFLKGCASGSVKEGYTYNCDGSEISFKYDEKMFETYYESELTLSNTDYVEVKDPKSDDLLTQIAIEMCLLFMDTCNPEALTV